MPCQEYVLRNSLSYVMNLKLTKDVLCYYGDNVCRNEHFLIHSSVHNVRLIVFKVRSLSEDMFDLINQPPLQPCQRTGVMVAFQSILEFERYAV